MANTITCNATFTVSTAAGSPNVAIGINVPMSGSNATWTIQNIATGTWQALNTSSLTDVRYFAADNMSTGAIQIATGSAGQNVLTKLSPNDNIVLPWSGSLTLYAQAFNSASQLAYLVAEA